MQLVEHLRDVVPMIREAARLLKPGGRIFFETPAPKTVTLPSARGTALGVFAYNFFDDRSHVRLVTAGSLAQMSAEAGLKIVRAGTSRNWLFAACRPFSFLLPTARMKFAALTNWVGWSDYLIARRPQ
jgi:2-polyprenyl-3-methyl-5-hydroxy-6-metoxy-1,4-benzoquinol methylase